MRLLSLLLVLFTTVLLHAQRPGWIAHTDCGDLMYMQRTCTDKAGNVYVAGKFKGEIVFGSALNDTSITKYAYPYTGKVFLARYNANGQLLFVVQFRSSGSAEVGNITTLPGGECVLVLGGQDGMEFVDANGQRHSTGQNGRSDNFFCINTDGSLKWSKSVNVYHPSMLEASEDGSIYMYGAWGRSYQLDACLLTFAFDGTPTDTLRFNGGGLKAMKIWGNYLLLAVTKGAYMNRWTNAKEYTPFPVAENNFAVFKVLRSTMYAEKVFELQCPLRKSYENQDFASAFQVTFNTGTDSLWTDLLVMTENGATRFMGKQYTRDEGSIHLIRLNNKGAILLDKGFDGNLANTKLVPLNDGSSVLLTSNWGTAFHYGKDSLALPRMNDQMTEIVIVKLDRNLDRVWWFTGGRMWSQTNAMLASASSGFVLAADLPASGTVLGIKQEVVWKTGMYVMQFRDQ